MATGATTNYFLPYPLSTDPVRVAGDIEQLATRIDNILNEEIEDSAALMWTGGTFTNGLTTPTYNDSTGKMSMSLSQDLQSTASPQFVGLTLTGDIEVRGGDLTTNQTTFNLLNATATTVNFAGAATTIEIGSPSGTTNINNSLDVDGDINIDGGDLTVSTSAFNLANTTATTVNFAGAATAVNIGNSSGVINSAGDLNIATGKEYKINNVSILNATTLGSSVVSSSLTSVGTVTSGTWSASFGTVSGENLTNLTAGNLTGTIPSTVLGNSTVYVGTTAILLNRSSAAQSLTGITSIDGSAATLTTARTIGMTGDVVWTSASFDGSGNVTGTSTISDDAVTYAKIQNVSAQYTLLGRISTGSGNVEELTADNVVTLINQASTAIAATEGGTGQTSYTTGDLLYASSSSALAKLAGVAVGSALISGGTGTAPSWGKIGLDTHVSGTLPVANGGTGVTTSTGTGSVVLSASPTFTGTISADTVTASTMNSTGSDITLLSSVTGSPSSNAALVVNRGTSDDVSIRWNETTDAWEYTNDGTTYSAIGSGSGGGSADIADILLFAGM